MSDYQYTAEDAEGLIQGRINPPDDMKVIDAIRADERSTVRGWHPKCATCGHAYVAKERYASVDRCAMGVDIQNTDLSEYYCFDHTDFDSPKKKD